MTTSLALPEAVDRELTAVEGKRVFADSPVPSSSLRP